MGINPPGGVSSSGLSSSQDPEVQALYDIIKTMADIETGQLQQCAAALLSKINPNMTNQAMKDAINTFLSQKQGLGDVWMAFSLSLVQSQVFFGAIDLAAAPYDHWECSTPSYTPMDGFAFNLYDYSHKYPPGSSQSNFATYLLSQLSSKYGSICAPDAFYANCITPLLTPESIPGIYNIYTDPHYAGLNSADLENVIGCLHYALPPFATDFFDYAKWYYNLPNVPSSIKHLGDELKIAIVSEWNPNSTFNIQTWITQTLTDPAFFFLYPNIQLGDLQAFAKSANYTLPNWIGQYLTAGQWMVAQSEGGADYQTALYIVSQMQSIWKAQGSQGSLQPLQQWGQTAIDNMFKNLPDSHFDEAGALHLETVLGLAIPPLQHTLFQFNVWASSWIGSDLAMLRDIMTKDLSPNWPVGTVDSFIQSLQSRTKTQDLYMIYPSAYNQNIQSILDFIGSKAKETPMDLLYRQALNMGSTYPSGSGDADLFAHLQGLCWNAGSNSDPETIASTWVGKEVLKMPPFPDYQPLRNGTAFRFLSLFSFKYCDQYFNSELISLLVPHRSIQLSQFVESMRSIISGYVTTHVNPSAQELQIYLNTQYASNDFCFQFPGLNPSDVNDAFARMGLQNPHTYTKVDSAYYLAYSGMHEINPSTGSPDDIAFKQLYQQLIKAEAYYDPAHPNVDLFSNYVKPWIANFETTSGWSKLTPATQQWFNNIYEL